MKLDLGVGSKPREPGFTTVDCVAEFVPDVVWDLETFPYPWADESVDEIRMIHVLEHLGQEPKVFLKIMLELHRILVPGGVLTIHAPHARSDAFLGNYQHIRPITNLMLQQFSRKNGFSPDLYATTDIDLEILSVETILMPAWQKRLDSGQLTMAELRRAELELWNVAAEQHYTMRKVPR